MTEQTEDLSDVLNGFNGSEFAHEAVDINKEAIGFITELSDKMGVLRDEMVRQDKSPELCDEMLAQLNEHKTALEAIATEPTGHGEDAFFELFKTGMDSITIAEKIYTDIVPKCLELEKEIRGGETNVASAPA